MAVRRSIVVLGIALLATTAAAHQKTTPPATQESSVAQPTAAAAQKPATAQQTPPETGKPGTTTTGKPGAAAPATPATPAAPAPETSPFKTDKEKISYAIGVNVGNDIRAQDVDIDADLLARGLKDALTNGKLLMTEDQIRTTMIALRQELTKRQAARMQQAGEKNMKEGQAFLDANKTKEGVVALPSGLQYKVLKAGDGKKPTIEDTVVCQYRGTLIDGTEFDSSYKRGEPATFPVKGVIKGWTEALQLMPVGSKWQLYVPSGLAYGPNGAGGGVIPPSAVLIFDVELVGIK